MNKKMNFDNFERSVNLQPPKIYLQINSKVFKFKMGNSEIKS